MHWWQTPFSSPSSSSHSSSSKRQHSDDKVVNKIFSLRSRALRSQQRGITRSTKLRYRSADDCAPVRPSNRLWRSPSSNQDQRLSSSSGSSSVVPQPLPLPELAVLLRRDAAASSSTSSSPVNIPLPSPKEPPSRGGEERERADVSTVDSNGGGFTPPSTGFGSNFACHDSRKNKEQADTRRLRKAPRELDGVERLKDNCFINIPISAPTSPFSSPTMSPQRIAGDIFTSQYRSPQVFQVWSAPEMPPLDMHLGLGFSYQMTPDKIAFSVDSSPLHSPRVSPRRCPRSPSGPTSPMHKKLSLDNQATWRDSNAQANVHPLPLPPGATSPTQTTSISQITAKPELMPLKSQWQKGKLIGRGTFGSVYVASNRETGALCAMKEVELFFDDPKSEESTKQLEQEIKVLSHLQHPNIVQYYGSEIIGDRFYIYLEYVHPGSINKYIHDHCGAMTESVVRNFTRHILSGLAYLHSTKTIHRDIKGANLLVDAYGVVKLADFGMAKHLTGPAANLSLKGSPYWMAPELLQSVMQKDASSDLALAVDIWSLGCTIIEMLNGKPPWSEYEGAAAMFKVLREIPPIPETLSSEGKDFLRCCFRRNPAERPTASKLLEHRFLKISPQLDVQTCTRALNGMKLMDKAESSREPNYKLEHLPVSPDAQTTRGKFANNETNQRSYHETSNLTVGPRHSPCSTLEALPGLSPPRSGLNTCNTSPSASIPSSSKEGARKS